MRKHLLLFLCSLLVAWNLHAQTSVGYQDNWPKPNGTVIAIVRSGNTVYLGGSFTSIAPAVSYGAALGTGSGSPDLSYALPNGVVRACVADGAGGWYIGGSFTQVGGQTRNYMARINADGTLHPWNPDADGSVYALAVSGGRVYAGGVFTTIGGQTRIYIAAIDTTTGAATSWNPTANGTVYALAVSGGRVYAGGFFATIGGQSRNRIAALDTATGAATSWNPNSNSTVNALAVSGGTVYVGGIFTNIGGQNRGRIAAIDTATGNATSWNPSASNNVNALAVSGGTVYAGGIFTNIGGQNRSRIAALSATNGAATAWDPGANNAVQALAVSGSTVYVGGSFGFTGGQTRSRIAAIDATTGAATSWNPTASSTVVALAVSGSTVYAGGAFTTIGGQTRNRIAAIDATTGTLTSWNPSADNTVAALTVSGSTVYVGGNFASIGGQSRSYIAAIDATTGTATAWNPNAGSNVVALAVSGSTVYAGGTFTSIGGQFRNRIAAIDTATGAATSWNPSANDFVNALTVSGGTVYAGGGFTSIGGQSRNRIAAIDKVTGVATSWNPSADNNVATLAISGGTVYAGGYFTSIGGQSRAYIAAIDAATGTATSWNPSANSIVYGLAVSGSTVYAGGGFGSIGGQSRSYIAAIDTTTGAATSWNPSASGTVYVFAVSGSTVYAGGAFTSMGGNSTRNYFMPLVDSTNVPVASVSIAASATTLCAGASVTFTATPTNASSPTYQWTKNSTALSGETAATYTTSTLSNDDTIRCQMTSGGTTVTSNAITMKVNTATASITASGATTFCAGDSVTLTASAGASYLWSNSATTQTITVASSGNYSVTVTGANGCMATSAATSVTANPLPVVSITPGGPTTFCAGNSVTLTASAGASYQWSNNGNLLFGDAGPDDVITTQAVTVAGSGNYAVTVTDSNGCSATSAATSVTVNPTVTPMVSIAASANPVQAGTSVIFTATPTDGGAAPQYQWMQNGNVVGNSSDVFTTSSISNGDVITCYLISNAVCITTTTASSNAVTMSLAYCTTYATSNSFWINNVTVAGINNNSGRGTNGYEDFTSLTGTMEVGGSYPLSANANRYGLFSALIVWIDFNQDYDFDDAGEQVIATIANSTFTGTITVPATALTGNTRMRVRGGFSNNSIAPCDNTAASNIEDYTINIIPPCPAQSVAATASTLTPCAGSPVTFTATPANGGATPAYQWMVDGTAVSGAMSDTFTTSFSADAQVSVVMTPTTPCPSTPTVTSNALSVTVNLSPVAAISTSGANPFCTGTTAPLMASPSGAGYTYEWKLGTTTLSSTTAQHNATAAGSYTVKVTGANGCANTSTAYTLTTKTSPAAFNLTAGGATTFCAGKSVTLAPNIAASTAASFPNYQWSNNGTAIPGATAVSYTATASGNYTIAISDNGGCGRTSVARPVTANPLPAAAISGQNPFCVGNSAVLNASPTASGNAYQWKMGTTVLASTTAQHTTSTVGSYTVRVTDGNGCVGTSPAFALTSKALPPAFNLTANAATTFCAGGSVTLSPNTATSYPTYQWSKNGMALSGATAVSYAATTSGNYTLTLADSIGCSRTSTARAITVNPSPVTTVTTSGPTTFCAGGSVVFTADSTTGQTNTWLVNGVSSGTSNTRTATASGNYQLRATLGSCTSSSSVIPVTVNPVPAAAISSSGPNPFCSGNTVVLNAAPVSASNTYSWTLDSTALSTTTAQHSATIGGTYRVTVTSASGCAKTSAPYSLAMSVMPTATITALGSTTLGAGGSVTLQANGGTGLRYQWYRNSGLVSGATGRNALVSSRGSYTVMVTSGSCFQMSAAVVVTETANKESLGVTSGGSDGAIEGYFSFSAFPNPADDRVTVRTNGAVSQSAMVQVMTLTGAAVKEVEMKNSQTEIDLSGMAAGVYLLRYKDAEGRTGIIRLVKQ